MRVMQAKYNSRVKLQQINSRNTTNGGPFALNYVGRGINQGCCANIPKAPSRQQSYGLYLKRATMGIGGRGGLASRVRGEKIIHPTKGATQATLTYKRPQEFITSNYINNKKSKAIRCEIMDKCSPRAPITHNKTVTVVNTGYANKYFIDGVQQPTLTFIRGDTYIFDQSDGSNGTHPLRFSTTSNGTHASPPGVAYTDGVTISGATVTIVVPDTAQNTLYYYCVNHPAMGGSITVTDAPTGAQSLIDSKKQNKLCYNNYGKKPCITEDLGYNTASDQINRRVAMRAGHSLTAPFESDIMTNGSCETTGN